jgi:hypothetical protein
VEFQSKLSQSDVFIGRRRIPHSNKHRNSGLFVGEHLSFLYRDNTIYRRNGKDLFGPARPVNFDFIHFRELPQSEVETLVGAGAVAAAGEDIGPLPDSA